MAAIVVGGIVVNVATGKDTGPMRIEIWGQGLPAPFATVTTTASGAFKAPIGEEKDVIRSFGEHARILEFRISRDGRPIPIKDGETLPVNSLTLKAQIKVEIPVAPPGPTPPPPDPPQPDPAGPFLVHGFVVQGNGLPLADAVVQAFDQDMRSREPLNKGLTDETGAYAIPYGGELFAAFETDSADLVFEVANDQGEAVEVARVVRYTDLGRADPVTGPIFNAPPDLRVDLLVAVQKRAGLSEFERLVVLLEPLMQGVPGAELTEEDIAFLSGDTTIDARFVQMFATSSKFGRDLQLPPPAFYGLGRVGFTLELHALARHGADAFGQALKQALQENLIPHSLGDSLDDLVAKLVKAIAAKVLAAPVVPGVPALGAVLSAAAVEAGDQERFVAKYAAHDGRPEDFWKTLRAQDGLPAALVDRIQTTMQLTVLARGDVSLVQRISALQQQRKMTTLRELATLDANDWLDELIPEGVAGIPEAIDGETEDAKRLNYAHSLVAEVDHAFPTAAIARRMKKEGASDVLTFLIQNSDFELDQTHIDSYLAGNPKALAETKDPKATSAQLKRLQRLFTVTPHYSEISVLAEAGIESARTVARMGPAAFVTRFAGPLGDAGRARDLYDRSARVASIAASLFVKFAPAINGVDFHATRRPT